MIVPARLRAIVPCVGGLVAVIGLAVACDPRQSPEPPTITAQGFDLALTRETKLDETPELRVRIEAVSGLDALIIRERSYEVDLAHTVEPAHFPLFGLSRRVWSKKDITIDFGPYVVDKLRAPGEYAFAIVATDRKQQSAEATLRVIVASDLGRDAAGSGEDASEATRIGAGADAERAVRDERTTPATTTTEALAPTAAESTELRTGDFELARVGPGPVASDREFGITWRTIESVLVVIRLSGKGGTESRFVRLESDTFSSTETRADLAELLRAVPALPSMELATANGAAAGAVFAIEQPTKRYLLRADHSETSVSDVGTTVTLTGRYKH